MRTDTLILAAAMDVLARDIQSGDGVANAAIAEAAQRLRELERVGRNLLRMVEQYDALDYGEDGPPFTPDFDELRRVLLPKT
jgi:hypothetical protein